MSGMKRGRPELITDTLVELVEEAAELGMTVNLMSDYVAVSRSTFYAWLSKGRQYPDSTYGDFLAAVRRGRSRSAVKLLAAVRRASGTDWRAAAWLLERRHQFNRNLDIEAEYRTQPGEQDFSVLVAALTEYQTNRVMIVSEEEDEPGIRYVDRRELEQ